MADPAAEKKEADDQEKKKLNNVHVAHGLLSTPFVSYIQYINPFSYV